MPAEIRATGRIYILQKPVFASTSSVENTTFVAWDANPLWGRHSMRGTNTNVLLSKDLPLLSKLEREATTLLILRMTPERAEGISEGRRCEPISTESSRRMTVEVL